MADPEVVNELKKLPNLYGLKFDWDTTSTQPCLVEVFVKHQIDQLAASFIVNNMYAGSLAAIQSTNEELFSSKKEFDKTKAQFAALIVDDKAFAKVDGATFEPPAAASASTAFKNQKQ